jgi:hypothetical protein
MSMAMSVSMSVSMSGIMVLLLTVIKCMRMKTRVIECAQVSAFALNADNLVFSNAHTCLQSRVRKCIEMNTNDCNCLHLSSNERKCIQMDTYERKCLHLLSNARK